MYHKLFTVACCHRWIGRGLLLLVGLSPLLPVNNAALADLDFEPTWELPEYTKVREQVFAWVKKENLDAELTQEAQALWPETSTEPVNGTALLDRLLETFALADIRSQALLEACNAKIEFPVPPESGWLQDVALPDFERDNLKLYYARWLAQYGHYEKAVEVLSSLKVSKVVDPAGLLFYRAISYQQLVEPLESRVALVQLLEHEDAIPERFRQVAALLQIDLAGLKDESLDHVSRRMNDVRRRLDIGLAGKQVQIVENDVVESLERIIKKLEQQQQQQQGQSPGGQGSQPMQDSMLPSAQAPMQVDQRDIGSQSGWGDLPPKEREQALQQIGREFPAHYRELIEQYFRQLANEPNSSTR